MANLSFRGPFLKAKRAEHHINDLERIFVAHINANKNALNPKRRGKQWKPARGIGTPIPAHTPTILGDALHNLRASLDHAYCALVEANGNTVGEFTRFPFCKNADWKSLKGSVEGHAKSGHGPSQSVIDYIINIVQPYETGNGDDLLGIHRLDIADKHMVLLPTEQRVAIENFFSISKDGGMSGISGLTIISEGQIEGDTIALAPGARPYQGNNNKVSFEICFGGGQPFEGQPIIPILRRLHGRVMETLRGLEQFIL